MPDRPSAETAARRDFVDRTVLWQRGLGDATDVVDAAVHGLISGIESPDFVLVAGLTTAEAADELGDLLPGALAELDIALPPSGGPDHDVLCAAALARRLLLGQVDAHELSQEIHRLFGHECHPTIEALSVIDDDFDLIGVVPSLDADELTRRTHAAATGLCEHADRLLDLD